MSNKRTLIATEVSYGIRKGLEYTILGEGYDWYAVKTKKGIVYADKWIFTDERPTDAAEDFGDFDDYER